MKECQECGATETRQWRKGPNGPHTLCNKCGCRYYNKTRYENSTGAQQQNKVKQNKENGASERGGGGKGEKRKKLSSSGEGGKRKATNEGAGGPSEKRRKIGGEPGRKTFEGVGGGVLVTRNVSEFRLVSFFLSFFLSSAHFVSNFFSSFPFFLLLLS